MLDTDDVVLHQVPGGYSGAWGNSLLLLEGQPTALLIDPIGADWSPASGAFPSFEAAGVGLDRDSLGDVSTRGDLRNPYGQTADQVAVVSIFRDAGGAIVGGSNTFVRSVPAHGSAPFSSPSRVPGDRVVSAEVVGLLWAGTWDTLNG